ncbi:hypothetical protein ACTAB8_02775 [Pseudomonas syringae]|uniref:hypothetical protein n=1 Tax=Pseudomonas syringae group TaxID=136849 RepID=UPI000CF5FF3E|nr:MULTISPECIES: hypothetical protein [Pseudomonas syringae group]AVI82429.1 hypothetical protein XJ28_00955 [Pseudomonas syringae pv. tomato]MBI6844198.1 hypothetical protein [Pseudomonas syringae]QBI60479.1 hypothetical protein EIZ61_02630 [Pseudomonas syringae]
MSNDVIKQAAAFLREKIPGTGSSHAHAAIAHSLGYASKKALLDDDQLDLENPNLVLQVELNPELVENRIADMVGDTPLKRLSNAHLMRVIGAGLSPACECCEEKQIGIKPLGYEDEDPEGWVCPPCASDEEHYGECTYCGPSYFYRADQLNSANECPEHAGESAYDPEEEEDMESYIEYMTKDL